MVANITADISSMIRDGRSINAIEAARTQPTGPKSPAIALCLMICTLRVRRTVVLATRKLVIIINRKLAASASILGCCTCPIPASKLLGSGAYKNCSTMNRVFRIQFTAWRLVYVCALLDPHARSVS